VNGAAPAHLARTLSIRVKILMKKGLCARPYCLLSYQIYSSIIPQNNAA